MQNDFALCPRCGGKNIRNANNRKWQCPDCGFDLYNNVAASVGVVAADESGRVLFIRRAKKPREGFLALPGGFVDPDESLESAARRECSEEIGRAPSSLEYLGSFPNTYEYKGILYKTCDAFFAARFPGGIDSMDTFMEGLRAQKEEALSLEARSVRSEKDADSLPLAFESARLALRAWLGRGR